jgi:hypothetical protein
MWWDTENEDVDLRGINMSAMKQQHVVTRTTRTTEIAALVDSWVKQTHLIFMDPCIVDYSVEIPTRCSFVIEFIIPKFIEVSTCFERHAAHHQEL